MLDRPSGTTRTSTTARRDRLQARLAADDGDPAALNGAAVLAILRRRKWLLLASIVLCPLLAFVAITQLAPRYTATGTLIYDASESTVREMQSILRVDPITDAVMATQAEVLRGMPVIEQVANRLNLLTNPEFNTSLQPPSWPERTLAAIQMLFASAPDPATSLTGLRLEPDRNATLTAVRAALTITPVKGSRVLEVSFTSEDPVIAAAAANDAMDVYVKSAAQTKASITAVIQRLRDLGGV
jgi:polysaccharide biosynthesis transport protein